MYLTDEEIAERYRDKRPGLDLVAIENAAVPVTVLNINILAQEKKHVELLEEFLLRGIENGLDEIEDISSLLGITPSLLEPALVSQVASHNIRYDSHSGKVALTYSGKRNVQDLSITKPVETEVPIAFDRTLWKPMGYNSRDLIRRGEAESQGMVLIPAKHSTTIGTTDVRARDVQKLVRTEQANDRFQVLDIVRVQRSRNAYLPVKMLVFAERSTSETELLIVVDGAESSEHQTELSTLGGAKTLNLTVDTSSQDIAAEQIESEASLVLESQSSGVDAAGVAPIIRQISVYEHGIELQKALTSAKSRLLIISPWIRRAVVDTQFVADIERLLRRGVQVSIGHGYGKDDSGSDSDAVRRLSNLQRRYTDLFTFVRMENTHAKLLICDDFYVTTSFNWLSFRGDPSRTYRMEEGTLIESKEHADRLYTRYSMELSGQEK